MPLKIVPIAVNLGIIIEGKTGANSEVLELFIFILIFHRTMKYLK